MAKRGGQYSVRGAVERGFLAGAAAVGAFRGAQSINNHLQDVAAERGGGHTQTFNGEIRGARSKGLRSVSSAVDVSYHGRPVTAIPSSNLGRTQVDANRFMQRGDVQRGLRSSQDTDSKAQKNPNWQARARRAARQGREADANNHSQRGGQRANEATPTRGFGTTAQGRSPAQEVKVVYRSQETRGGGGKPSYSPAFDPPPPSTDGQAEFPWGVFIPPGLAIAGMAEALAGKKLRRSNNVIAKIGGYVLEGGGLLQTAAGTVLVCGSSIEAIQQATPIIIETPKPADTAKPPEQPTRTPELSFDYLNDPTINSPLADWNIIPSPIGPWIHEKYTYDTRPDGSLAVYYGSDGTKYAFAVNSYFIPTGFVIPTQGGQSIQEVDYGKFYMMLRQKATGGPIEAMVLLDPNQDKLASLPIDAGVYHYPTGSGLQQENSISVRIETNAEGKTMYTVIRNGKVMPLVMDASTAATAATPTPSESDIFNVVYLDKNPSIFGGEVHNPDTTPTASGIAVDTGGETVMVTTTVKHSETTNLNIDRTKIQVIDATEIAGEKIIVYRDSATNIRYIWNQEIAAWSPEIQFIQDWIHPETAPFFERSVVDDGSADLSATLYAVEHPDLIPPGAVEPHYKINAYGTWFDLGLFRDNQFQYPDAKDPSKVTILERSERAEKRPFGWEGLFKTKDGQGNVIYVLVQHRKNSPTPDNPRTTMNIFFGFDKSAYENFYLTISGTGDPYIIDETEGYYNEMVIVFPPPPGFGIFNPASFTYKGEEANPNVARLQRQNAFLMFLAQEQEAIKQAFLIYTSASNKFSSPTQSFSADISTLPSKLSFMIVYPGTKGWTPVR